MRGAPGEWRGEWPMVNPSEGCLSFREGIRLGMSGGRACGRVISGRLLSWVNGLGNVTQVLLGLGGEQDLP